MKNSQIQFKKVIQQPLLPSVQNVKRKFPGYQDNFNQDFRIQQIKVNKKKDKHNNPCSTNCLKNAPTPFKYFFFCSSLQSCSCHLHNASSRNKNINNYTKALQHIEQSVCELILTFNPPYIARCNAIQRRNLLI